MWDCDTFAGLDSLALPLSRSVLAQFDSDDDEASNTTQQTDHRRHQGPLALETEQQQARCSESAEHPGTVVRAA